MRLLTLERRNALKDFCPADPAVEIPHLSEDGEAMQQIENSPIPVAHAALSSAGSQPCRWFALYTTSRHEKHVAHHLSQREIECFLPLYKAQRKWANGLRVTLDLPLFPGYMFVHIRRSERTRVLGVPGALSVVGGTGGEPAWLPDSTITALRIALAEQLARPHPVLTAGQRVRIRSGALAGFEGIVVRSKSSLRVVLTLEHIMQSYAVEVSLDDLELLSPNDLPRIASLR
ncbi:MAG: UpxY family transcription antiterminator [Terracidiphilus sp.]